MELFGFAILAVCFAVWTVKPQECQDFWQEMGPAIHFSIYCFLVALILRVIGLRWYADGEGVLLQTFPCLLRLAAIIWTFGLLVFTAEIIRRVWMKIFSR